MINDDEKLFMINPLKALWIKIKNIEEMLKKITKEIDSSEDENLSEDFFKDENLEDI